MAFGTAAIGTTARLTRNVAMPVLTAAIGTTASGISLTLYQPLSLRAQIRTDTTAYVRGASMIDPATGRAPYRLVVVDFIGGGPSIELDRFLVDGPVSWTLNDVGTFSFSLPVDDPKVDLVIPVQRELQVWRGRRLIWWGIITKARTSVTTVQFQAVTLEWYLSRRVVGKVPKDYLYDNRSFEDGMRGWTLGWDDGSIPAAPPSHAVIEDRVLAGGKALRLGGSDDVEITTTTVTDTLSGDIHFAVDSSALTSAGIAAIDAFIQPLTPGVDTVTVVGHTDSVRSHDYNQALSESRANSVRNRMIQAKPGLSVAASGRGETQPVATNATAAGRAANRRAVMTSSTSASTSVSATGHSQHVRRAVSVTVSPSDKKAKTITLVAWVYVESFVGPSKDGWAVRLERKGGPDAEAEPVYAYAGLNEDTPVNRWIRMECSVEVPPDGLPYTITVFLYPPNGVAVFDETSLTASDQLGFFDVDQADIVAALVQHAQDPAMGKSDLKIGTNCPPTGVVRTREYPFSERIPIIEALFEWPTLADGMDLGIDFTGPSSRVFRTWHPRKGTTSPVYLVLGDNIMSFEMDVDADQTSTQVIVQADGEGSDREEGVASNPSLSNGVILEKVYSATPGSSVSSLNAQAARGVGRYSRPVKIPAITTKPEDVEELLDRVRTGDIVHLDVRQGWVQEQGRYRVTGVSLDPMSEQITFTVTPWDEWSV